MPPDRDERPNPPIVISRLILATHVQTLVNDGGLAAEPVKQLCSKARDESCIAVTQGQLASLPWRYDGRHLCVDADTRSAWSANHDD
jgi:hypothetical protein